MMVGCIPVYLQLLVVILVVSCPLCLTRKPYDVVVVSVFKNEAALLKSWMQHYIDEGIDHFYLVDNGSTDKYMSVIQKFPAKMVTLVRDASSNRMGLQDFLMNKHLNNLIVQEANWVIVADVDEYMYTSSPSKCIGEVLNGFPSHVQNVWVPWKVFGSNGHQYQPHEGIIRGFTKRAKVSLDVNLDLLGYGKSLTRVAGDVLLQSHSTHNSLSNSFTLAGGEDLKLRYNGQDPNDLRHINESIVHELPLQLNHYMYQSRDYYRRVKCKRGGGQSAFGKKYTMAYFDKNEHHANQVVDTMLLEKYVPFDSIHSSFLDGARGATAELPKRINGRCTSKYAHANATTSDFDVK
jgi:hypothetical protein